MYCSVAAVWQNINVLQTFTTLVDIVKTGLYCSGDVWWSIVIFVWYLYFLCISHCSVRQTEPQIL